MISLFASMVVPWPLEIKGLYFGDWATTWYLMCGSRAQDNWSSIVLLFCSHLVRVFFFIEIICYAGSARWVSVHIVMYNEINSMTYFFHSIHCIIGWWEKMASPHSQVGLKIVRLVRGSCWFFGVILTVHFQYESRDVALVKNNHMQSHGASLFLVI